MPSFDRAIAGEINLDLLLYSLDEEMQECARPGNIAAALPTLAPGGTEAFRDLERVGSFSANGGFHRLTAL
jgi:hypothetical protein